MFKIDHKKAQAATELAVFGALLIFLLGTIVRNAVSNSYTQDQNFQAMRIAMLASWEGSLQGTTAHSSASVLFLEDRLSPDFNKYGDLDRSPYIAMGSGSFSYEMIYPVSQGEVTENVPIMDIYINGQHFPFTEATYLNSVFTPHVCPPGGPYLPYAYPVLSQSQCLQNQCLRDARSWVGGYTKETFFITNNPPVAPVALYDSSGDETSTAERNVQMENSACIIFTDLSLAGIFSSGSITVGSQCHDTTEGVVGVNLPTSWSDQSFSNWDQFVGLYGQSFPAAKNNSTYLQDILNVLRANTSAYKLFYTVVANSGTNNAFPDPPAACTSPPCVNQSLISTLYSVNSQGAPGYWNGCVGLSCIDHTGDMMFDLLRNGDYTGDGTALDTSYVESPTQFGPPVTTCTATSKSMRCYVAWKWAATAGTNPTSVGLITTTNNYPQYDIDGRLKEVTIYGLSSTTTPPSVTVGYEDFQGGDIDASWDSNTCGPKPGLQATAEVLTFTQDGTFLQINEGKLYNPETGQVVRSANKRDSIDLISRSIQLSNNTGRFCANYPLRVCPAGTTQNGVECANPNPVELCVDSSTTSINCNQSSTIRQTCYDVNPLLNTIFVRSRLEDRRGGFWMTGTSGKLRVQP